MSAWEGVMQKHAKSFYLASLFFPKDLLPSVKALYALCRWLDDAVDEAPNTKEAEQALLKISSDLNHPSSKMLVNQLYKANNLNLGYMNDLIQGAKEDIHPLRIKNQEELIQYCYKVAGTVGLAMFDLMQVTSPLARANAVDLGIAMQITNISRDIKEDWQRNRVYVPADLLAHYQVDLDQVTSNPEMEKRMSLVCRDLLSLADQYYASAEVAFNTIPWRTRGAIIIASRLYRGIGLKLLRKGAKPMQGRTYLNGYEKAWVVMKALTSWLSSPFKKTRLQHDQKLHRGLEPWREIRGFLP